MSNTICHSLVEENYLSHHGIMGMKWGIRRYQNPDGTLTAAGRKRYGTAGPDGNSKNMKNKHVARVLNDIEEEVSSKRTALNQTRKAMAKHEKKLAKAEKKGNMEEIIKRKNLIEMGKKGEEILQQKIGALKKSQKDFIALALAAGKNVTIKDAVHNTNYGMKKGADVFLYGSILSTIFDYAEGKVVNANKYKVSDAKGNTSKLIDKRKRPLSEYVENKGKQEKDYNFF